MIPNGSLEKWGKFLKKRRRRRKDKSLSKSNECNYEPYKNNDHIFVGFKMHEHIK